MIKGFNEYIKENFGADTIDLKTTKSILQPDLKRSNRLTFYSGASGSIPTHWNNSPFLSGGKLTSAFGLNPRKKKRKKALNYYEFMDVIKKKN
jgi:hypothetical protein